MKRFMSVFIVGLALNALVAEAGIDSLINKLNQKISSGKSANGNVYSNYYAPPPTFNHHYQAYNRPSSHYVHGPSHLDEGSAAAASSAAVSGRGGAAAASSAAVSNQAPRYSSAPVYAPLAPQVPVFVPPPLPPAPVAAPIHHPVYNQGGGAAASSAAAAGLGGAAAASSAAASGRVPRFSPPPASFEPSFAPPKFHHQAPPQVHHQAPHFGSGSAAASSAAAGHGAAAAASAAVSGGHGHNNHAIHGEPALDGERETSQYARSTLSNQGVQFGDAEDDHYYQAGSYGQAEDEDYYDGWKNKHENTVHTPNFYSTNKGSSSRITSYNKGSRKTGSNVEAKDRSRNNYYNSNDSLQESVNQSQTRERDGEEEFVNAATVTGFNNHGGWNYDSNAGAGANNGYTNFAKSGSAAAAAAAAAAANGGGAVSSSAALGGH